MKRAVIWCLINIFCVGLFVSGAFYGVLGAERTFIAITFISTFLGTFAAFNEEVKLELRAKGRAVNNLAAYCFDCGMLFVLVWIGWWFVAFLFFLDAINQAYIFDSKEKIK